jgi:hypothetical protein
MRYFKYPADQPKLSSVNPYRLISVDDHFGANTLLDNPPVAIAELQTVTIIGLYRPDSSAVPKWVADFLTRQNVGTDFLIVFKEWIPRAPNQMRAFKKRVGHEFRLTAPDHLDVRVRLNGLDISAGDGSFQAYGAQIFQEDRARLVPGVAYCIQPINIHDTYRWVVSPDLKSLKLKD